MPVGLGVIIMLLVALIINNLSPQRRYPEFWF
jgi:CBS-domain-containing membrane protein